MSVEQSPKPEAVLFIRGKRPKRPGKAGKVILLLGALLAAWMVWVLAVPCRFSGGEKVLDVPLHNGAGRISRFLEKEGVIRSGLWFRLLCVATHTENKLRAGEYAFPQSGNLWQVWSKIRNGQVKVHLVTIPEGFTSRQIAEALEAEHLTTQADFLAVVQDAGFCEANKVPAKTAEGFLFPDTYEFIKGMKPAEICQEMIQHFYKMVSEQEIGRAEDMGFGLRQWVTLASIVEKEAEAKEERAIIAAVFLNRLKKDIRLESCATVNYVLGTTKPKLTWKDLGTPSPYNTYRHRGLPPGPICNPGKPALLSVLSPAKVDYLFFVSKGDGTHQFSKTIEEHIKAKNKYKQKY